MRGVLIVNPCKKSFWNVHNTSWKWDKKKLRSRVSIIYRSGQFSYNVRVPLHTVMGALPDPVLVFIELDNTIGLNLEGIFDPDDSP
jgi:hypothetical protein